MSNFHPLEVVGCGSESQLQMGENLNKLSRITVNMSIICEHVHRLELLKSFSILGCCGNVASVPKNSFYQLFLYVLYWTCMPEIRYPAAFYCNW